MNALLLTGGRVIDPANRFDALADVLLSAGKVAAVGSGAAAAAPIVAMSAHSIASFLAAVTAFLGRVSSSTPFSNLARALASSTS